MRPSLLPCRLRPKYYVESKAKSNANAMERILARVAPASVPSFKSAPVMSPIPSLAPKVKVPKWSDDDLPSDYLKKFGRAMTKNGILHANWGTHLSFYVTGKAQAALKLVKDDLLDNYDTLKETLLNALEDTPAHADRRYGLCPSNLANLSAHCSHVFALQL